MKKLYILTLLLATGFSSQAQNLTFTTEQHQQMEIVDEPVSSYIRFTTPTVQEITYRWTAVENTLPEGWEVTLCDYPNCYIGIPETGVMQTITMAEAQNGSDGFFSLAADANEIEGQGVLSIYVYDAADAAMGDTVSWTVTHGTSVGIDDLDNDDRFEVYPNPATDVINIKADGKYQATIYNIAGQKVISLNGNMTETVDVSKLNTGLYIISYTDNEGNSASKRFVVR